MEAELNDNCPAHLYPAIGLRVHGSGTVSVCIMDPSNWNSLDEESNAKHTQVWNHISVTDVYTSLYDTKFFLTNNTTIQYNKIIYNVHKVEKSNLRLGQSLGGRRCGRWLARKRC